MIDDEYGDTFCLALLLCCLPVCLPAVLPVCLYGSRLFVCLSSFPPVYWSVLSFCLSAICSHLYTVVPLHVFCCCAAYQFVCLLSCLSVFLSYCLFAICPACHLTCHVFLSHHLFVCLYINLLSCLSFCQTVVCSHLLLQSLLPVLPVDVLPTSTSASRLTYLCLCQPLFCLSFILWSVYWSVWALSVCCLLQSFCYSPSYLSCLLLSCLPLCQPAILPVFLSVMLLVCLPVILTVPLCSVCLFACKSSAPIFLLQLSYLPVCCWPA